MEIVFLGNWASTPAPGKSGTSFVIDGRIACDFGPDSLRSMVERGLDPDALEQVMISHMHYDHFAGLTGLLWYRAMSGNEDEIVINGPPGIEKTSRTLLESYHTPHGFHIYATFDEGQPGGGVEVFHGSHTVDDNAYRISRNGKVLFYSGDTEYSREIINGATGADILVHEMTYPDELKIEADLWKHSTVSEVISTMEESGSKMLVPVHLTQETFRMMPALQQKEPRIFSSDSTIIL